MALCAPVPCGCSITSTTLSVTGTGAPWNIEVPQLVAGKVILNYLSTGERDAANPSPTEPIFAWIRGTNSLTWWDGSIWRTMFRDFTSYTPALSGTGWALGSGTATGIYSISGNYVDIYVTMTFGAGATFGAVSPVISLPLSASGAPSLGLAVRQFLDCMFWDASGSNYPGQAVNSGLSAILLATDDAAGGVIQVTPTSTVPFTWVAGDSITLSGRYPVLF